MTNKIEISLPWPPSTNQMWRTVTIQGKQRTLLSKKGREFRATVGKLCVASGIAGKNISGRLKVELLTRQSDRRKRDLDNLLKATFDSLTHAGVWGDDSQIDDLHIKRGEIVKSGHINIAITEVI